MDLITGACLMSIREIFRNSNGIAIGDRTIQETQRSFRVISLTDDSESREKPEGIHILSFGR